MPGYKVCLVDNAALRDGLKCSYCTLLLKDPIQTTESGQRYCKECYKEAVRYRTSIRYTLKTNVAMHLS